MNELENKIDQLEKYIEVKEQECDDLQDRIDFLIDRNDEKENIIDELEKYLKENESDEDSCNTITYTELLDKLNELKGDNK